GRVHGDVDAPPKERLLDLLDEDAAVADLPERPLTVAVTGCRDRDEGDLDARPAQRLRRPARLRQREPRTARSDANEHRTSSLLACSARRSVAGRAARAGRATARRRAAAVPLVSAALLRRRPSRHLRYLAAPSSLRRFRSPL